MTLPVDNNTQQLIEALYDAAVILYKGESYRVSQFDDEENIVYAKDEETGDEVDLKVADLVEHGCNILGLLSMFDNRSL